MKMSSKDNIAALCPGRFFALIAIISLSCLAVSCCLYHIQAWADDPDALQSSNVSNEEDAATSDVVVSSEGDAALIDDTSFALSDFSRAQKGSNRDIDGTYVGYTYYLGSTDNYAIAVASNNFVLVYIPKSANDLCDVEDTATQDELQRYFIALDEASNNAGVVMDAEVPWYFTSDTTYELDGAVYNFALEVSTDRYYMSIIGTDGSDVVTSSTGGTTIDARPTHVDFAQVVSPDEVDIQLPATGIAAFWEFLTSIDYSPLWVTLRTTLVAIVLIFILGLAAAYFTMRIPKRAQAIFDAIFTIPMVLPPTVCGFLLLLALGSNSPVGQWFDSIGFKLVFSWPATVIAATVVAFPLMYRNSRGAFEGLDPNMMDAARTLGWSNFRVFLRLMLPLSWSSIAAATVLAFASALGEFGATLFLAGNYVGITRTIPIAIYFEWMSGNTDVAIFWAVVVIIFSFVVIIFVNLLTRRTTKYRQVAQ